VQKELDLPYESAEQLKKGIPVDGATFEEAQPVLRAVTENVLLEIQKTFDFFKATASSDQIDRIMLSGGGSRVDGFKEMVQERFNAPVEEFNPFRAVAWDAKKLGGDASEMAATAAVAVGLALRTVATDDSHQSSRWRAPAQEAGDGVRCRQASYAGLQSAARADRGRDRVHGTTRSASSPCRLTRISRPPSRNRRVSSRSSARCRLSISSARSLQQRVALIEQLRSGQSVPVQLLDAVSKSIPTCCG
jgi:cell division ATPase FtsA